MTCLEQVQKNVYVIPVGLLLLYIIRLPEMVKFCPFTVPKPVRQPDSLERKIMRPKSLCPRRLNHENLFSIRSPGLLAHC